jgi:hypothetical protein
LHDEQQEHEAAAERNTKSRFENAVFWLSLCPPNSTRTVGSRSVAFTARSTARLAEPRSRPDTDAVTRTIGVWFSRSSSFSLRLRSSFATESSGTSAASAVPG